MRALLSWLLTITVACVATAQDALPELVKRVSPSVVKITVHNSLGGAYAYGSGFFISDTLIATNHHVIDGASLATVRLASGEEIKAEGLVAEDRARDLAILRVPKPGVQVKPLTLQTSLPQVGERVIAIGTPAGYEQSVSEGIISGVRQEAKYGTVLQTTAASSHGSSGGPVLNMRGEVVGVVCYMDVTGTLLQFAIAASSLDSLKPGPLRPLDQVLPPLESNPPDVPAEFMKGLSEAHQKAVAAACQFYARLPDGTCVDVFRTARAWQLLNSKSSSARREKEALGLGRMDPDRDYRLEHEDLPAWGEASTELLLVTALPGHRLLRVVQRLSPTAAMCDVTSGIDTSPLPEGQMLVRGPWRDLMRAGDVVHEPLILVYKGTVTLDQRAVRQYSLVYLSDAVPTAPQLAFAVVSGRAQLVNHRFDRFDTQPTTTIESRAGGTILKKTVPSGSPLRKYKWSVTTIELKYKDPADAPPALAKSKPKDEAVRAVTPATGEINLDKLTLKDGRVLSGRVVSESPTEVQFRVIVKGIEATMRFPRIDIVSIAKQDTK